MIQNLSTRRLFHRRAVEEAALYPAEVHFVHRIVDNLYTYPQLTGTQSVFYAQLKNYKIMTDILQTPV